MIQSQSMWMLPTRYRVLMTNELIVLASLFAMKTGIVMTTVATVVLLLHYQQENLSQVMTPDSTVVINRSVTTTVATVVLLLHHQQENLSQVMTPDSTVIINRIVTTTVATTVRITMTTK